MSSNTREKEKKEDLKNMDVQEWLVSEGYSDDEAYTAEELQLAVETFRDYIVNLLK
jgi:hypothetical protein